MNDKAHLGRVTRRTVEDEVYARIRQAILSGEIAGGERLVHDDLAERFGTSRIPVRDALKRLCTDGLVETEGRRRGYRVAVFGRDDIVELYALRELLEVRATAQAALNIDADMLAALQHDHDAMAARASAGERDAYVEINQRFHGQIYAAAGQPRAARIIDGLWRGLPPLTPISSTVSLSETSAEHAAILDALIAGDADAAGEAMRIHIVRARDALVRQIDATGRLF